MEGLTEFQQRACAVGVVKMLGLPQAAIESVCRRDEPNEKAHEPAKRLRLEFWI